MTVKTTGTLPIGIEVDGVVHRDFELRSPTVLDNIQVTEELVEAGEATNPLRIGTAMMARQIVKLGTLTTFDSLAAAGKGGEQPQVTTALIRSLHPKDWNHLDQESVVMEKKLLGVVETPQAAGGSTSSSGAPDTTSTPPTSTT